MDLDHYKTHSLATKSQIGSLISLMTLVNLCGAPPAQAAEPDPPAEEDLEPEVAETPSSESIEPPENTLNIEVVDPPTFSGADQTERAEQVGADVDQETPTEVAADAAKVHPTTEISGAPGQGLTVRVSDEFSLNIRSRIQIRYQLHSPPEDEITGERTYDQLVNIGTARLWFSGNVLAPELTYMIQLAVAGRDFRDGATSPIYDAFLDWKAHRDLSFRGGQYFVPFDRLRTIREWGLQMADRPRPVLEFTLDRDVGVMAYSDSFLGDRSPIAWRLGVFGGGGTNLTTAREPGALVVGRLEFRPLGPLDDDLEGDLERRRRPAAALGAAVASNINTNRLRSTTGATFVGGTTDYRHAALDLVFKWGGFALQGEYLWKEAAQNEIVSTTVAGEPLTEYTRSGQGWIAQASYLFGPPLELVGRLTRMYASSGTDPAFVREVDSLGQEVAAGANDYINGHKMKLQADWIARMPHSFDFERADHVAHVQFDVTF